MKAVRSFIVGCGLVASQLATLGGASVGVNACGEGNIGSSYVYLNGANSQGVGYSSEFSSTNNKADRPKVVVVKKTEKKSKGSSVLGKLVKLAAVAGGAYFIIGKERLLKAWNWFRDDFCGGTIDIVTASSLIYIVNGFTNVLRLFK